MRLWTDAVSYLLPCLFSSFNLGIELWFLAGILWPGIKRLRFPASLAASYGRRAKIWQKRCRQREEASFWGGCSKGAERSPTVTCLSLLPSAFNEDVMADAPAATLDYEGAMHKDALSRRKKPGSLLTPELPHEPWMALLWISVIWENAFVS